MQTSAERAGDSSNLLQRLLATGLIVVFLVITIGAGLLVFDRVRDFIAASEILPEMTGPDNEPSENVTYDDERLPTWQGTDRINILLMGIDQRQNEGEEFSRTDTMIVLTLDPVTMTGGMLSIPRDLWVPVPGYDKAYRINTAHFLGDAYDYPGGGVALAAETVQYNLGIRIDHYVRVNFTAFERLVDLIGGIDVYVEHEIDDPQYPNGSYGYEPLYIPAGDQHFDGEMALKYARTRKSSPRGDFDRADRQQQVMRAVFEKVTRLDMIPQLAPRAPEIWRELQDSVVTDLKLDQIIALARLSAKVDPENIKSAVIDENYTAPYVTPEGAQVLLPERDKIRELVRDFIIPSPSQADSEGNDSPAATPTLTVEQEAATIEVLNGTTRSGLAGNTSDYLEQNGLEVANVGNADTSDYAESLILVYTAKMTTANALAQKLNLQPTAIVEKSDDESQYDITIILGTDYELPD